MNYYSHHIGDYLVDTAHLSILEDGVYRRLMDRYYTTESAITNDEQALFRVLRARTDDEKEAVRVVLQEFFVLTDAGWAHKRCDSEIAAYKDKSIKSADAANKRWNKPSNADAMPTHSERIADAIPTNNQEPITNNHKPVKTKADATATRLPADWLPSFDDEAFCKAERPDLNCQSVASQFVDYWIAQPSAKARKADWPATWRNWVRNQRQAQPRASPQGYESSKDKSRRETMEQLTGRAKNEQRNEFIDIN